MEIDELTIKQIREIQNMGVCRPSKPCPFEVGKAYLIRTVTMTWLGRVTDIKGNFLCLADAAWIADTGRYHRAAKGEIADMSESEIEPVPNGAIIGMGSIVDAVPWEGEMPLEAK